MKFKIGKNAVTIIIGVTICLFSLLGILSANVPGLQWIATGLLASVGFVGFWVFLPILFLAGLYMIIAKRFVKMKFDLTLFGVFVLLFGLLVLLTNLLLTTRQLPLYNSKAICGIEDYPVYLDMFKGMQDFGDGNKVEVHRYIELNSFLYYFLKASEYKLYDGAFVGGFLQNNSMLGGGFVGFLFAGMFNTWWTPVGTNIASGVLIGAGLILILNIPLVKLFKFIISKIFSGKNKKKEQSEVNDDHLLENYSLGSEDNKVLIEDKSSSQVVESNEVANEEELLIDENKVEEVDNDFLSHQSMVLNSFNNSHGVQKATFSMNETVSSPFEEFEEGKLDSDVTPAIFGEENKVFDNLEITPKETIVSTAFEENHVVKPVEQPKPIVKNEDELSLDIASRRPRKAKPLKNYKYPETSLIQAREKPEDKDANKDSNDRRAERINDIFAELSLGAHVVSYTVGPTFTRFDVQMDSNRSVTTIDRYVPDLASRLGGIPVRFEKLVIGKSTSGLEVGNDTRTVVGLRECLEALPPISEKTRMLIPFGKDIDNKLIYAELPKFPHMLVAGCTGSGKSVFMHSVIATLITRNKPDELKLILIDPKRVEMNVYRDIPHLLCPNISEPHEALVALNKLVIEMERRYSLFSEEYVNEIKDYNEKAKEKGLEKLPYIVIFVDEYADLSETCKEIRGPVVRIAQKARAAGIHLVLATQRPSVNVIDGVIKANISTHVALMVNNATDSMVILGEGGAESLSGNGDMIVDCALISRQYKPRLQGSYCTLPEINSICDTLRQQMKPQYDPAFLDLKDHSNDNSSLDNAEPSKVDKDVADDELYKMIRNDIVSKEYCSISYIQRSYGIGFPRAGRMFGRLQKEGVVDLGGDAKGSKVLIHEPVKNEQQMGSVEQSSLHIIDEE